MITEIHIDSDQPTCRVIHGPARGTFISTPTAVAMAILASARPAEDAGAATRDIQWTDMLATHGLAIGRRRQTEVLIGVYPQATRTVSYGGEPLIATFPPLVLGLTTTNGRHTRACVMVADMRHQARFGVSSEIVCLSPFPYGNVYSETGYICWDSVEHSDVVTLPMLERAFFTSGFNSDLFYASTTAIRNLPQLVASVRPGTPLPTRAITHAFPRLVSTLLRDAG